jgi:hypothetical protein
VRPKSNYDITHIMSRWANVLIGCVAALTAIVLIVDAIVSLKSGTYLNLGSGVWLALARDTHDGVFYRPLWSGAEYGGTRYFPILFVATAALMRAGIAAVPAGVTVSMAGLVLLAVAVAILLKRRMPSDARSREQSKAPFPASSVQRWPAAPEVEDAQCHQSDRQDGKRTDVREKGERRQQEQPCRCPSCALKPSMPQPWSTAPPLHEMHSSGWRYRRVRT